MQYEETNKQKPFLRLALRPTTVISEVSSLILGYYLLLASMMSWINRILPTPRLTDVKCAVQYFENPHHQDPRVADSTVNNETTGTIRRTGPPSSPSSEF
jgi:hypothetical protein